MNTTILLVTIILFLIVSLAFILVYYQVNKFKTQEFKIKMESAKTARNSHILNMTYKDLITIVDTNMLYYIEQAIIESGIHEMETDEQRSLLFNTLLTSVCAKVESSLSTDIKTAIEFFVTQEHLRTYIKDSSRILLIAKIEQRAHPR